MSDLNETNFDKILAAAMAGTRVNTEDGKLAIIVPPGFSVEDLERLQPNPDRIRETRILHSVDSLCSYIRRFEEPNTTILCDEKMHRIVAVLDYHGDSSPEWGTHEAIYSPKRTTEWHAWLERNGEWCPQVAMAEFLEDRIGDVADPTGAELLEIVTQFQETRQSTFNSKVNISSGEFHFQFSNENKGGKGTIHMPSVIELGIAPFKHHEAYRMKARLRYRINEGDLMLRFDLVDPETVEDDAFNKICDQVSDGVDTEHVYFGAH